MYQYMYIYGKKGFSLFKIFCYTKFLVYEIFWKAQIYGRNRGAVPLRHTLEAFKRLLKDNSSCNKTFFIVLVILQKLHILSDRKILN